MNIAEYAREPVEFPIAGALRPVKPRTLAELGEVQAWFLRTVPTPLARAARGLAGSTLPKFLQEAAVMAATRAEIGWPPRVGSAQWFQAVDDADVGAELVRWVLAPTHPDLDVETARAILDESDPLEVVEAALFAFTGARRPPKSETAPTQADTSPETATTPTTPAGP